MVPVVGSPVMVLGLAAGLHWLRRRHLRSVKSKIRLRSEKVGWPLVVASLFGVLLAAADRLPSPVVATCVVAVGSVLLACVAALDLCCRQYLGASPRTLRHCLPDAGSVRNAPTLVRTYVLPFLPVGFTAATAALFLTSALIDRAAFGSADASVAIALCAAAFALWTLLGKMTPRPPIPPSARPFLFVSPDLRFGQLQAIERKDAFTLDRPPLAKPRTILLVINESTGQWLPSSEGDGASLADRIRALSGAPAEWIAPSNVVANSSLTEVSFPSILTGVGAHESADVLHRMPFLFDLAKASGYRTALLMSTTLDWGNLGRFVSAAAIDDLYCADNSGQPQINDLGIDDAFPVMKFEEILADCNEPLFAVVFTNALHLPFQNESRFGIPAHIEDRRSRALWVVETAHERLLGALKRAGRYDGALVTVIGDHGELPPDAPSPRAAIPRPENYSEWVLRTIFMIKPPRDLPTAFKEALNENRDRLIANIDIAPTLADLFGATLREGLSYAGHSLFRPVPADRLAVATNTNDWRPWRRAAIVLARGRERLICDRLDFLRYESGETPDPVADASRRDELIREALRIPTVSRNIARVYRQSL